MHKSSVSKTSNHQTPEQQPPEHQPLVLKIVGAVLAAGASMRFGGPKQLARLNDSSLIDIAVEKLADGPVDEFCVVLGCHATEIQKHFADTHHEREIQTIQNEDWQEGIASSIRCATNFAISREATHLLLITCDQPFVDQTLLDRLVTAVKDQQLVACSYGQSVGIPAIFARDCFAELLSLTGDKGAKKIIQTSKNAVLIDFTQGDIDIDTRENLSSLSATIRP